MAFPAINSNTQTQVGTASTTHNINMPPTVAFGDLLIVILSTRTNTVVNTPAGWQGLCNGVIGTTAGVRLTAFAKRALGTEGGTTVNFSTVANAVAAARCLRVLRADWYGSVQLGVQCSATNTGTSTTPTPFGADPGVWDVEDTLWVAMYAAEDDDAVSAYPTNCADNRATTIATTGTSTCSMAMATANSAVSSFTPNTFTMAASDVWVAGTIAIRPNTGNTFFNQVLGMTGVIGHWRLNEATGTIAYDNSPSSMWEGALNGTYVNTPTLNVTSQVDKGIGLAAASQERVGFSDLAALELPTVGSLVVVFELNNFDSFRMIAGKKGGGFRGYSLWSDSGNRISGVFGDGSTEKQLQWASAVANTWYCAILTWNTTTDTYILYINGVAVVTNNAAYGALSHTTEQFSIGAEDAGGFGWQDGTIDEVVVFNRELSLAENESLATASGLMVTPVSNTRVMGIESLDRVTQTRVARMENIARIVDTGVIRIESLDRTTQIRLSNVEFLDRATTTRLSNVESLDRITQTREVDLESLNRVAQTRDIDYENLARIAELSAINIENLAAIVAVPVSKLAIILLESLQRLAIQEATNVESLRRLRGLRSPNVESLAGRITQLRTARLENLQRLLITRTPNLESLGSRVTQLRVLRIESLMRLARTRVTNFENLQEFHLIATRVLQLESLDRIVNTRLANLEYLDRVAQTRTPNIESLGNPVTQIRLLRIENLQRIRDLTAINFESQSPATLLFSNRILNIESLQRLRVTRQANIESLMRLLALRAARIESLGNRVSQLRTLRLESLQRLAFTRIVNFESMIPAGLTISNRVLQIESLTRLRLLKTTNYESLRAASIRQVVTNLESLIGIRSTSDVRIEYIEGVGMVIHISPINIETLRRLVITRLTNWEVVTQGALIPPDLIVIDPGGESGIIIIDGDGQPIIVVPPDDNNIIVGGGDSDVIIVWEDSQQLEG